MADKKHTLSLLMEKGNVHTVDISTLKTVIVDQLAAVAQMERDAALRAILIGLALWRVKAALKHGEFRPWLESNIEKKKSQVNNYMRLATVFVERSRVTKQELLALPADTTSLSENDREASAFFGRATKFVGDCSLNELLVKYGIKGVTREGDTPADAGTANTGDADGQMFFAEIAEHVLGIRTSVLDPKNIARLSPRQLDDLRAEIANLNTEFTRLYEQARGKAK